MNHTSVVLTGITGAGKSSACNFLIGEAIFEVDDGMMAVTSRSGSHTTVLNSRKVKIIDTPGFCEDDIGGEVNFNELGKAIILAKDGIHAFALVINVSHRFTSSQVTLVKEMELFDDLWPYMFIIFSGARSYGGTDKEQRQKIYNIYYDPNSSEHLKTLLNRVEERFMMLESTENNQEYRNIKRNEFFTMVDKIYSTNGRLYSNKLFERAIELYQDEKEKEKNKEEKYKADIEQLTIQMNEKIFKMKEERQKDLQSLEKEAKSKEEKLQQGLMELKGEHNEKIQSLQANMNEQIRKAQADAQRIARERAEQQQRQLMAAREAELANERAARLRAEQQITRRQNTYTSTSYRSSSSDDCIVL